MINKTLAVIGGDLRQAHLADMLSLDGYIINAYALASGAGMNAKIHIHQSLKSALENSQYIILPLPFSADGVHINAPNAYEPISIESIIESAVESSHILGGKITDDIYKKAADKHIKITDYFLSDELIIKNIVPTVEGTIQIMMEEMPITIHGSNCLITGFGRISKLLSSQLKNLGANVTVCARKSSDIAYTEILGYTGVTFDRLNREIHNDCIINTVPYPVITKDILKGVSRDILIIDLASKPGGVDMAYAGRLGLKTVWALSLPGKVAPVTSGRIIKDTIMNIINIK